MVDPRRVAVAVAIAIACAAPACGALLNADDGNAPPPPPPLDAAADDAPAPDGIAPDAGELDARVPTTIGFFGPSSSTFVLRFANASGVGDRTVVLDGGAPKSAQPFAGHWNAAHSPDTFGYFVGGAIPVFHFFGQFGVDETVEQFGFAMDGGDDALPVVGDWNGDGIATVGFYIRSTGNFFLRDANGPGQADYMFQFAAAGGRPIAGDWDGDGKDGIGVFFPDDTDGQGRFFLKNALTFGEADVTFNVSAPGASWYPLAGDWDGDGVVTAGLFDASRSEFRLFDRNVTQPTMTVFTFGASGVLPIAGKWQR